MNCAKLPQINNDIPKCYWWFVVVFRKDKIIEENKVMQLPLSFIFVQLSENSFSDYHIFHTPLVYCSSPLYSILTSKHLLTNTQKINHWSHYHCGCTHPFLSVYVFEPCKETTWTKCV